LQSGGGPYIFANNAQKRPKASEKHFDAGTSIEFENIFLKQRKTCVTFPNPKTEPAKTNYLQGGRLVTRTIRHLAILFFVCAALSDTLFAAAPTITSIDPASARIGTSITITGTNFGSTGSVKFNGTTATKIVSWSATSIQVVVPFGATTGKVVVTVGGIASNGVSFTVSSGGGIIR